MLDEDRAAKRSYPVHFSDVSGGASIGNAPEELSSSGVPRFKFLLTLAGSPANTVKGPFVTIGMPFGVGLVAPSVSLSGY
jgi:hypothetical protein